MKRKLWSKLDDARSRAKSSSKTLGWHYLFGIWLARVALIRWLTLRVMKKDFLRLLRELDEDELREELRGLYERFPVLREYYRLELGASTAPVLDRYRKQIRKAFFPARGHRVARRGRSESKKILKAFAEISIHPRDLVELYFYRVEVMVDAIDHFRIDREPFYKSVVSAYEAALGLAEAEVLVDSFRERINRLVDYYERVKRIGGYGLRREF